jgi:TonB-dependent receptor
MKQLNNISLNKFIHLWLLGCMACCLISSPVLAQDTDQAQDADDEQFQEQPLEEVIIIGVRRSMELSLDAKREADSIMDGIAAEGIGKFPDLNLAESLSRITGVQINTDGAGGERREGQISVRGLPSRFARTQVNGQTMATPNFNGGFTFGAFESDVISAVNVIKTPTAKYDEGGLSGIVDIRTMRPLDLKKPVLTFSLETDYEELSQDVVPNAAVTWGNQFFAGRLGAFASLKWSDQSFRTDSARINGYDDDDTDGDGLADLYTPNEARYNSRQNDGSRVTFAGGLEFDANDEIRIGVTSLYSSYELANDLEQLRVQDPRSINPSNLLDGGEFGDTYSQAQFINPEIDTESRLFDDEFFSWGLTSDIEWTRDDWTVTGVAHISKAGYDRWGVQSRRNIRDRSGNGQENFIDTGAGNVNGFAIFGAEGDDWTDPAFYDVGSSITSDSGDEWRQRFLGSTGTDRDESEQALQVDVVRDLGSSFFTTIEGGLKYRKFERSQRRPSWSVSGWDFSGIDPDAVLRPNLGTEGDGFFGGTLGGITNYLVPEWSDVYNALLANNTCEGECWRGLPFRINNNRTFDTELDIESIYLMARFDGMNLPGELPIRGNFGVRHVRSDRAISAFTESDLLVDGEQRSFATTDFTHTLPSVNLIWDVRDDIMMRFAWYESMVRPNANAYRVDSSVNVGWLDDEETIPEDVDIELGNPDILPFTADAWDVSFEWYNRRGSGISLAYFSKEVANGIEDRVLCPANITDLPQLDPYNFTGIITGGLTEVGGECQDQAGVPVFIEDSINNAETFTIDGWEIGILQNFDFLDGWMSGFGFRANYTKIDTSEGPDFDSSGNRLPLENVSEDTYNLIIYYEAEQWGVRMAYNNRSEYFIESTGSFTGEDRFVGTRDRLDLSATWRLTDNMRIRGEIFNLTNERRIEYQGLQHRVRDLRYTGRTYSIGVRYRF